MIRRVGRPPAHAGAAGGAEQGATGGGPGVREAERGEWEVGRGAREAQQGPREGGRGERGAAVVELLVVFLTLLLPLVYVMVVMADVQRALLATSSAAREVGRVYVTGSDGADAERRAGWRIGRCWPPTG